MAGDHIYDRVKDVTGLSDADIGQILGVSQQLVQKRRAGLLPTYHTALQRQALVRACQLYRDQVIQGVAEIELLS